MNEFVETSSEEPAFRLLGMAFMAPVAGYVLITPSNPSTKVSGQIIRALSTILISAIILAVITGTDWNIGHVTIRTQYSSFNRRKIEGSLGIQIGLNNANIQLKGSVVDSPYTIEFSEKFILSQGNKQHIDALHRGLPFSMITAVEYLQLDGFRWNGSYNQAGYYTSFVLWCAFSLWLLTNILWPLHLMYSTMCLNATGFLLVLSNFVYTVNLPKRAIVIPYDGNNLEFSYGWCYFTTLILGIMCMIFGSCIYVVNSLRSSPTMDEFSPTTFDRCNKLWYRQISNYHKLSSENECWSH